MKRDDFRDFVLDQLAELGDVVPQAMFGGVGLYHHDVFFAIIHQGRLYFKIDDQTRRKYEARGMGPFRPNSKQTLKTYYEVSCDSLEDRSELVALAREAIHAAS